MTERKLLYWLSGMGLSSLTKQERLGQSRSWPCGGLGWEERMGLTEN